MFVEVYRLVFFPLFLLFTATLKVKGSNSCNNTAITTTATNTLIPSTSANGKIQSSSTIVLSDASTTSKTSTEGQQTNTTNGMSSSKGMESYVIIIIATLSAVFLICIVILLLLCIFRRRRSQRIERERNLSYNNMNYESTVKFRSDMNSDGTTLGSDEGTRSPQKSNNNPRKDAQYEVVDLPTDKEKPNRQYENVTPQKINDTTQPYENVTPMVSSANDKAKASGNGYEEVLLDSPREINDDKKNNDKYYENVELKI